MYTHIKNGYDYLILTNLDFGFSYNKDSFSRGVSHAKKHCFELAVL